MDTSNAAMAGGNSLDSPRVLQYSPTWSTKPGDTWNSQLFMSLTALSQQSQTANHGSRPSVLQMLLTVRPSADSCVWREVPKRVGCYGHQPSVTQRSVSWDKARRQETLHQFVLNGRRKRFGTRKDKSHKFKQSTVVVATANVGTLRPGGLKRLNASSRGVTPRCEEFSVKLAEAGLHAVMVQETRLQVKGIASTSKYDLRRSPANEQGLDGTHVWPGGSWL